ISVDLQHRNFFQGFLKRRGGVEVVEVWNVSGDGGGVGREEMEVECGGRELAEKKTVNQNNKSLVIEY
ncbi:2301_t:CDS:2, partial [Diversispora eburnea]